MRIQDSYPLSPVQHGMLIHSLSGPDSGVYVQQLICALHEDLNVSAFHRAWQRIVRRHPIFRTSLSWEGPGEPLPRHWWWTVSQLFSLRRKALENKVLGSRRGFREP